MKPKALALHSGGLDSCVAVRLAMAEAEVALAITFDYGQAARVREIEKARLFCKEQGIEHRVIALPWLANLGSSALTDAKRKMPQTTPGSLDQEARERAAAVWVPNRNGIFIAVAAGIAESCNAAFVVAGFNREEAASFPDNSADFIDATERALSFSTLNKVTILCPTREMDKREIAAKFAELGLRADSFWCCYEGGERLCGRCESCCRAIRAFRAAGAWDLVAGRFAS